MGLWEEPGLKEAGLLLLELLSYIAPSKSPSQLAPLRHCFGLCVGKEEGEGGRKYVISSLLISLFP